MTTTLTPNRGMALRSLREVIEYLEDEAEDFFQSGEPQDHIYLHVRSLQSWLDAQEHDDSFETEAREVLELYGRRTDGMSIEQVKEALEREGQCGAWEVVMAVKGGANYPVRMPPEAIGIGEAPLSRVITPEGEWTGEEFEQAQAELVRLGKRCWTSDVIRHLVAKRESAGN